LALARRERKNEMARKTAKRMTKTAKAAPKRGLGLLERLAKGPVICAEGYLFEFERRGYLQAGAFVPMVVLEHPDLVEGLHRDFVRAGSDVVEAFTYYAHRAKLRIIGRERDLERINRTALRLAKKVARETGCSREITLWHPGPDDPVAPAARRILANRSVGGGRRADFIVGETYSWRQALWPSGHRRSGTGVIAASRAGADARWSGEAPAGSRRPARTWSA
jgi:betaine-homocysteine S-methyltransferase